MNLSFHRRLRRGRIGVRRLVIAVLGGIVGLGLVVGLGGGWWLYRMLTLSLPQLDGVVAMAGLSAPVAVERDALGVPTIKAQNRVDLAAATGFVHAQERFFQMDLLRRNAAGELAELVGEGLIAQDRQIRVHRFRDVARRMAEQSSPEDRALVDAYTRGVNAGLAALGAKPFEYLVLGIDPAPWQSEDCVLVLFSMFLDLQGDDYIDESAYGVLADRLPRELYEFLTPRGTPEWDAPLDGTQEFAVAPPPGPEVLDLRAAPAVALGNLARDPFDDFQPGSNNWAVSGAHTRDGRALVANDMHLRIAVPHIWFRARFEWHGQPAGQGGEGGGAPSERSGAADLTGAQAEPGAANGTRYAITGATLPGTPAMVVGSNGHIAWGFTNAEGDWSDLVVLEVDPERPDFYLTPDGPRPFETVVETIKVAGKPAQSLEVRQTIWGPVVDQDHRGRPRALKWVAHDPSAVNLGLLRMETVATLDEALELANRCGTPHQNFVVADDQGRIGWTIIGRIPRRLGFDDSRLPSSWADGSRRWAGYLDPAEYPRVIDNPPHGRIWTANARVASGDAYRLLGDGGLDLGARARQIRDRLLAVEQATEADMLAIQLDDRAVFLERWQKLLCDLLESEADGGDPRRGEALEHLRQWQARAATDSVGYAIARNFRRRVVETALDPLAAACTAADSRCRPSRLEMAEGPAWQLVSQQPPHLLEPRFETWNELLLDCLDQTLEGMARQQMVPLADQTWGRFNTTRIQHPISLALPLLGEWLDMPAQPLPGDSADLPRIQTPQSGASQRMCVAPGHEADGYFHMPCGQSGHPLSPHYRDSHQAWADGVATPFLPGPAVNTLTLEPSR